MTLWERPRAKPWDIKKGRRFACCRNPVGRGHCWWCAVQFGLRAGEGHVLTIPKFSQVSAEDLVE